MAGLLFPRLLRKHLAQFGNRSVVGRVDCTSTGDLIMEVSLDRLTHDTHSHTQLMLMLHIHTLQSLRQFLLPPFFSFSLQIPTKDMFLHVFKLYVRIGPLPLRLDLPPG